jgi:glycosyltransferase involved in cell wall biosynthesis
MIRVLFAPDWRNGVPYQRLLAEALADCDVQVDFLSGYRRGLPLWRGVRENPCDLLHLHWPEAYYMGGQGWQDWLRRVRFRFDLANTTRICPLIVTAHNLYAHNQRAAPFARINAGAPLQRASAIIAHSEGCKTALTQEFQIDRRKCEVIPHGDLSAALGAPVARAGARNRLGLGNERLCLMFGAMEPYKGIEEIIDFWKSHKPDADLAIVGKPMSEDYAASLSRRASDVPSVFFKPGWLSDEHLRDWLSAADCALFNYQHIFTSGAACLSRSWGIPVLIPSRLATVDLDEPSPFVFRFDDANLKVQLSQALDVPQSYEAAASWREKCRWDRIGQKTADIYRKILDANQNAQRQA